MRLCVHYIVMKKESLYARIAIIVSLGVLAYIALDIKPFTFENTEFLGWVVAALSASTAILLWWNIQNYFLFKRTIEEDTKRIVQKVIEDKSSNLEGLITFVRYIDFYNRHIDEKAIDGFIQAIGKINNSTEKEGLNDILFCLIEITKRYNEKGNTCHIYRGKRSDYLDVLSKVDLEGIEKVKKFISDANELSY